jgi:pSer/pThr/pTyr-binding forkhead associated (FHA) protein
LTVGRTEGELRFPSDQNIAQVHARVTLEDGLIFIEDLSKGGESVFLRLSAGYTLQDGDIIIMGNEAFRFHEDRIAISAATIVGATLADLNTAMSGAVAEFVQLDAAGRSGKHYPFASESVQFGRTKGTYTFPEDKLMSRLHARTLQRGEDFVIEDAGSRNGTFVKVRGKAPVPVGSAVLVGSRLLKLVECS